MDLSENVELSRINKMIVTMQETFCITPDKWFKNDNQSVS